MVRFRPDGALSRVPSGRNRTISAHDGPAPEPPGTPTGPEPALECRRRRRIETEGSGPVTSSVVVTLVVVVVVVDADEVALLDDLGVVVVTAEHRRGEG